MNFDDPKWLHWGFAAQPMTEAAYREAKAAILPVPYDGTVSYRSGARDGPAAIVSASRQLEFYDEGAQRDWTELGIATLPELTPDVGSPETTVGRVREAVGEILDDGKWPLMLGGEHSITAGAVEAVARRHPGLTVLQIDAHLDLRDGFMGSAYSHAAFMRTVLESENVRAVVPVGIRNVSEEEARYCRQRGLKPWAMRRIRAEAGWIESIVSSLEGPVYLTVDLDGLDPSVVPNVGTPEPGGLLWDETLALLDAMFASPARLVGADIVELCPQRGGAASDFAAAKLAYRVLGGALGRLESERS